MSDFTSSFDTDHMQAIREDARRDAIEVYTDRFREVEHENIDYVANVIEKAIDDLVDAGEITPLVGLSRLSALREIEKAARRPGFYPKYWVILTHVEDNRDDVKPFVAQRFHHRDAAIQRMMGMDLNARNAKGYESTLNDRGTELVISNPELQTTFRYTVEER